MNKKEVSKIERLCFLYNWVNEFLELTDEDKLITLENSACGTIKNDYEKAQQQLDVYQSLKSKFILDEDQNFLLQSIYEQMKFKNRNKLDQVKLKADVCEFILRIDNPFYDPNKTTDEQKPVIASFLYTAYPAVAKRIKRQLEFELNDTANIDEIYLIKNTLNETESNNKTLNLKK